MDTLKCHPNKQRFFQVQASSTAEYHQVEQRVAAQTVGTVYRYASHFTYGEQTRNDLIHAFGVLGDRLAVNVGGNAAHHIVASRNNRNRSNHRVNVCESLRQFADAWQTAVQHFLAQVVEFEHYVVAIRTATVAGDDFFNHRASNHVTTGKVFGVRSITLHETLAVLVDQVTTFTTATFGHQYTGAGDAGRVELPHFDVLYRYASAQRHADAVTGVDVGVGGGLVDATGAASGKHCGLGLEVDDFAALHVDGGAADDVAVLVLHQIQGIPFGEDGGLVLDVLLIQGMQQGVTCPVGSRRGTGRLLAAKILGLPYPGGPLIDKWAAQGNPNAFSFPVSDMPGYTFSFSGIKTAILYFVRKMELQDPQFVEKNLADLCASIQFTLVKMLLQKLKRAARELKINQIAIAGGVSANSGLRQALAELGQKERWNVFVPAFQYCTDNAGMIAMAAYFKYQKEQWTPQSVSPMPRMSL